MSNSVTSWTTALQSPLSSTISWSSLKFITIELVMPSNQLILCHPLPLLPSVFPSIGVFSSESALHIRWSKYQSLIFSISPFNEYSELISFRIDWVDLLAVQRILESLLQHDNLKGSILQCSAFFMVQLISIHDYWKNHSFNYMVFCRQSDVSTLQYVCNSFPSKKQASFNFMAAVTVLGEFGAQENKVCHCFHFFSSHFFSNSQ